MGVGKDKSGAGSTGPARVPASLKRDDRHFAATRKRGLKEKKKKNQKKKQKQLWLKRDQGGSAAEEKHGREAGKQTPRGGAQPILTGDHDRTHTKERMRAGFKQAPRERRRGKPSSSSPTMMGANHLTEHVGTSVCALGTGGRYDERGNGRGVGFGGGG